jgi:NADH-quinone oxidoreductase subunit F
MSEAPSNFAKPDRDGPSRLLERARRLVPDPPPGNAVGDLLSDLGEAEVAARRGLPRASVRGIRSFYDQLQRITRVCDGTACHFHGGELLRERLEGLGPVGEVRCLGHCYATPAFRSGDKVYACPPRIAVGDWLDEWGEGPSPMADIAPIPRLSLAPEPVVLRHLLAESFDPFADYELPDGETILAAVEFAKVNGRGGAAFPTALKWRTARDVPGDVKYVVANGDEGDPGSYVDRLLLEEDPHTVLAGMLACARATGATDGIVYIRAEYPHAQRVMRAAIQAARERGVFGPRFRVEVVSGAGSYVCGEENALLRSIEGRRGEPAPKPPYPTESGLFGKPTVVQNVETLALVPWAVRTGRHADTKAVCLGGAVRRPGVVEVTLGTPLREVLMRGGGGPSEGRRWRMALVGGPMGRVLPERSFDTPLSYEALPGMGHGGIVVLDETVSPRALAAHLFAFARSESCGNCTPCRVGTARLAQVRDRATLERLLATLEMGSLCGFGSTVPKPARDLLAHFGEEIFR